MMGAELSLPKPLHFVGRGPGWRWARTASIVVVVSVGASVGPERATATDSCFPEGVQETFSRSSMEPWGGKTYAFLDASQGMSGFVQSDPLGALGSSNYATFVGALSFALPTDVQFHKFGTNFQPITNRQMSKATDASFYSCGLGAPMECEAERSRPEQILALAESAPSEDLFIIVSDLFLDSQQVNAFRSALESVINPNRAVGILGYRSGFSGPVFLPDGGRYIGARSRPFFTILIGPPEQILAVKSNLDQVLGEGGEFSIFSSNLVRETGLIDFGTVEEGVVVDPSLFPDIPRMPQFRVAKSGNGLAIKSFDLSNFSLPGGLRLTGLQLTQRVWFEEDPGICEGRWRELPSISGLVNYDESGDDGRLALFVDRENLNLLPSDRHYLVHGSLWILEALPDPELHAWLKEWGTSSANLEGYLASAETEFLPALNLGDLGRFLEQATEIARNSFGSRETVVEFAAGFRVEN